MGRITIIVRAAVFCVVLTAATTAQTPVTDLDSCHDDLDSLRKISADAAQAADDAKSKKDDFSNCKEYPDIYDLMHDHCANAEDEYKTSVNDLEDKMGDLDHKLRSIQGSCDYQFTINRLTSMEAAQRGVEESKRRLCASYHKLFALGMSPQAVLQTCKAQTEENWCRQCLGLK